MFEKLKAIVILGVLVIVVPFWGIPDVWKQWILFGIGVLIVFCGVLLQQQLPLRAAKEQEPYVENKNDIKTEY